MRSKIDVIILNNKIIIWFQMASIDEWDTVIQIHTFQCRIFSLFAAKKSVQVVQNRTKKSTPKCFTQESKNICCWCGKTQQQNAKIPSDFPPWSPLVPGSVKAQFRELVIVTFSLSIVPLPTPGFSRLMKKILPFNTPFSPLFKGEDGDHLVCVACMYVLAWILFLFKILSLFFFRNNFSSMLLLTRCYYY